MMYQLMGIPSSIGTLEGRTQEVMIGYSDSANDSIQLAASWAQYKTQVELCVRVIPTCNTKHVDVERLFVCSLQHKLTDV